MTKPADSNAKRLIARLSPLIEEHLDEARREFRPRIIRAPDPRFLAIAERVAAAVGRLDSAKYTAGEITAQRSLERQARALRTALKRIAK